MLKSSSSLEACFFYFYSLIDLIDFFEVEEIFFSVH